MATYHFLSVGIAPLPASVALPTRSSAILPYMIQEKTHASPQFPPKLQLVHLQLQTFDSSFY